MGYYSFGAHQSHLAKLSAKVSSFRKTYLLCSQSKWKHWGEKTFFFSHEKISVSLTFSSFPPKSAMKWLIAFHKYRCIRGSETAGNVMDHFVELHKLQFNVNTYRHTGMSARTVCACSINMEPLIWGREELNYLIKQPGCHQSLSDSPERKGHSSDDRQLMDNTPHSLH